MKTSELHTHSKQFDDACSLGYCYASYICSQRLPHGHYTSREILYNDFFVSDISPNGDSLGSLSLVGLFSLLALSCSSE